MNDTPRRLHPGALISFLLGLASLGLLGLTGFPGLIIGFRALRDINTSDGQERGRWLALTGMALGGLATLITVLGLFGIVILRLQEVSRRTACTDHLRQIGLATIKYADTHGTLPPATSVPAALPPEKRISWLAEILPLLGDGQKINGRYQDLARAIDRSKAWDDPLNLPVVNTPVRLFLCPGHPDYAPNARPALSHYVGVAGVGHDAASLPRDNPNAGVFANDHGVRIAQATAGISYTMLVIETARDNGPWLAGSQPTVRGIPSDTDALLGPGHAFGGLHPGVVMILWLDGSARSLSDSTPADQFRRLATLHRGKP